MADDRTSASQRSARRFQRSFERLTLPAASTEEAPVAELAELRVENAKLQAKLRADASKHEEELASSGDAQSALQLAQQLMVAAPEFHATNLNPPAEAPRLSMPEGVYKTPEQVLRATSVALLAP